MDSLQIGISFWGHDRDRCAQQRRLPRGAAGLNTVFATGAKHKLDDGAVVQSAGAVHVSIHPAGIPSVSTQIAALRHLLLSHTESESGKWFEKIRKVRPWTFICM